MDNPNVKIEKETSYYVQDRIRNVGQFWIQKDIGSASQIKFKYQDGELLILSVFRFTSPYFPFRTKGNRYREARPGEVQKMKAALLSYIKNNF